MSDGSIDLTAPDAGSELPEVSQRHKAFADNLLLGGSVTQAALDAGYSPTRNRDSARATGFAILRNPSVAAYLASRREELQAYRDAAMTTALMAAPSAVARLEDLAAKDLDDATAAELGQIRQANETLLTIADVIPNGNVAVDARSVTLNIGSRDPRLAGYSLEQLDAILAELEARQAAGNDAVEASQEPDA